MILLLAIAISALSFGIVLGRWLSTGGRFLEPERASVDELHVEPWDAPRSPYRLPPKEAAPLAVHNPWGLDVWGRPAFRIVITLPRLPAMPDPGCPFRAPSAGSGRDEVAGDRLRTRDGHGISRVSESCQAPDHPSETGITPDLRSAQPEEKSTGVDS